MVSEHFIKLELSIPLDSWFNVSFWNGFFFLTTTNGVVEVFGQNDVKGVVDGKWEYEQLDDGLVVEANRGADVFGQNDVKGVVDGK